MASRDYASRDDTDERTAPGGSPRGARRRGDALEDAIRATVVELLAEVGYAGVTMDLVAARARTGKATLYRRWPGKAELVVDAARTFQDQLVPAPDTGTFRDDLFDLLRNYGAMLRGQGGSLAAALVSELAQQEDLALAFRRGMIEGRKEVMRRIVSRGVERGDVRKDAPWGLVSEMGPALLLTRHLVTGEPFDDAYVRRVVDDVIMPLVRKAG